MPIQIAAHFGAPSLELQGAIEALSERVFERPAIDIAWRLGRMPAVSVFTAEREGLLVGFKAGYAVAERRYKSWLGAVHPAWRGRGIAGRLMAAQHGWLLERGFQSVETATRADNTAMARLNGRCGFVVVGARQEPHGRQRLWVKQFGPEGGTANPEPLGALQGAPILRAACLGDAAALAVLLPDLGYSASPDQITPRLQSLLASSAHAVLLAELDGRVVGLCLVASVRHLASEGYAELLELVVRSGAQRRGIGSALLAQAQAWASGRGHERIRLRSGEHRTQAHAFYERLGFAKARASFAFERLLT